jgi:DNA polymerase-3 subunit delta
MKISPEQLAQHLQKSLAPIYFVHGDEHLLVEEARQRIRDAAEQQAYSEHISFTLNPQFKWEMFWQAAMNLSLFSENTLIELFIPNGKPGDQGAKELIKYAEKPPTNTLLLIISSKIDSAGQRSVWYKTLLDKSVVILITAIERSRLPQWLKQRMQALGLKTDSAGLQLLADRTEGNLLSAAQDIEKLRLIYGETTISAEQIAEVICDNSRFDVFKLIDSMQVGEKERARKILAGLKAEGVDPILILWAISRELRILAQITFGLQQGKNFSELCTKLGVWTNRQSMVQRAIQNKSPLYFHRLLHRAHEIDAMLKGAAPGNPWLALLGLVIK